MVNRLNTPRDGVDGRELLDPARSVPANSYETVREEDEEVSPGCRGLDLIQPFTTDIDHS